MGHYQEYLRENSRQSSWLHDENPQAMVIIKVMAENRGEKTIESQDAKHLVTTAAAESARGV